MGAEKKVLQEWCAAIVDGFRSKRLQRTPHLILLDTSFYSEMLQPLVVRRSITWMKTHHVFEFSEEDLEEGRVKGVPFVVPSDAELVDYLNHGNCAAEGTKDAMECVSKAALQTINLAQEWCSSYVEEKMRVGEK